MEITLNEHPLISVAMGIYNCADTLGDAVACIQNQTCEDWELILCDDCSTDDTYRTALALAGEDPRITVLKNQQNLTLAPTLNRCIRHARGEYIARMDGDDLCPPDRFELELDAFRQHPEMSVVSCLMELFDEDGVFRTVQYDEYPDPKRFAHGSQFCHAGCMVRAADLRAVGCYRESSKYARVEDYDLWVRMYAAGYRGYNVQKVLYSMRDDRNALRRRKFKARRNESRVAAEACRMARLPFYKTAYYAAVPVLKYFVPRSLYQRLHNSRNQ